MTGKITHLLDLLAGTRSGPQIEASQSGLTKPEVFPEVIAGLLGILLGLTFQHTIQSMDTIEDVALNFIVFLDLLLLYMSGALILILVSVQLTEYSKAKRAIIIVISIVAFFGFVLLAQPQGSQILDQLRLPFLLTFSSICGLEWLLGYRWKEEHLRWACASSLIAVGLWVFWP